MIDDYLKDLFIRWFLIYVKYTLLAPLLFTVIRMYAASRQIAYNVYHICAVTFLTKLGVSQRNQIKPVWQNPFSVSPCWLAPIIFPSFNVFVEQEQRRAFSFITERPFSCKRNSAGRNLQISSALSICAVYLRTKKWSRGQYAKYPCWLVF